MIDPKKYMMYYGFNSADQTLIMFQTLNLGTHIVKGVVIVLKNFLVEEAQKLFGGTEENIYAVSKKILFYVIAYAVLMFLTFAIAGVCVTMHSIFLAGLFGCLFTIEVIIISVLYAMLMLCITAYYGAHFFRKGWDR